MLQNLILQPDASVAILSIKPKMANEIPTTTFYGL